MIFDIKRKLLNIFHKFRGVMAVQVDQSNRSLQIFTNDPENMKAHFKILIDENIWLKSRVEHFEQQAKLGQKEIIKLNETIRDLSIRLINK